MKIDVNRHLAVMQRDNRHSFTSTIFLFLTKCSNKVVMDFKQAQWQNVSLLGNITILHDGDNYILTIQYGLCWHMQILMMSQLFLLCRSYFLHLFCKSFRLPSSDLLKDPYINRYAQHESVYPALYFYSKHVMWSYDETPSSVLSRYFWENVWVNTPFSSL